MTHLITDTEPKSQTQSITPEITSEAIITGTVNLSAHYARLRVERTHNVDMFKANFLGLALTLGWMLVILIIGGLS